MDEKLTPKIFIDGYYLNNSRGMSEYTKKIIECSEIEVVDLRDFLVAKILRVLPFPLWEQCIIPLLTLHHGRPCVLISPYNTFPLFLPKNVYNLIICHDLMFMQKDFTPKNWRQQIGKTYRSMIYSKVTNLSKRRWFVAVSNDTMDELKRLDSSIDVECLPNSLNFQAKINTPYEFTEKFGLVVTGSSANKNNDVFITALNRLIEDNHSFNFVVCGIFGPDARNKFLSKLKPLNIGQRIIIEPRLSIDELEERFAACSFLLSYSSNEGFGIPLLQAIKYNKPVFASNIKVYHEILGDSATAYFDPTSPASLVSVIIEAFNLNEEVAINYSDIRSRFSVEGFRKNLNITLQRVISDMNT